MEPDMALSCRSYQDDTKAPWISTASEAAWPLCIHMVPSGWPDPGHPQNPQGQLKPDMAIGNSLCPEVSMALGGSTSQPDQHGPGSGTVLRQ